MGSTVSHLSSATFDETVGSADKPVLVDFWAEWCGPCKAIAPILDKIASDSDDLDIAKLDVDANGDIALRYGVQGIPTMILFKDGSEVTRFVGAMPEAKLRESLAEFV